MKKYGIVNAQALKDKNMKAFISALLVASSFYYSGLVHSSEFTASIVFQGISADPGSYQTRGAQLGYRTGRDQYYFGTSLRSLKDSTNVPSIRVLEWDGFMEIYPLKYRYAQIGYEFGLGYGQIRVDGFRNKNSAASFFSGIKLMSANTDAYKLNARIGYRYYFDVTENTRCRDGSTSSSVGRGTCSSHGGISFYQDKFGDGGGLYAGCLWNFSEYSSMFNIIRHKCT